MTEDQLTEFRHALGDLRDRITKVETKVEAREEAMRQVVSETTKRFDILEIKLDAMNDHIVRNQGIAAASTWVVRTLIALGGLIAGLFVAKHN